MQIEIHMNIGNINMMLEEWDMAINNFETCNNKTEDPIFFMNFANCFEKIQKFNEAVIKYSKALELFKNPEYSNLLRHSECLFARGNLYQKDEKLKVHH